MSGEEARLALDYVSPLPPVRSGIADYSADLLPHLEPLCDLRVIALPGQPIAREVERRWLPQPSGALGSAGERVALYHMGNNEHHAAVYRLAMEHPGVVVLHDVILHHFLLGETLGRGEIETYRRRLRLEHGALGEAAAGAMRWGAFGDALQFGLPANRRLVERQRGVLVHSAWARDVLREDSPDLAVHAVPMGIPLPQRPAPERGRDFRGRHGIPDDAPLLGSFGFQTPMKRPETAVRALSAPEMEAVHLVIAGQLAPTLDLDREIAERGLGSRVHVTGFLDYDEFEAAIVACDLALNLRYPSAGETSAALLRVLALGRPTVVSEYAQFAELPVEAAARVPVGEGEVEALVRVAADLLGRPRRLRAMGEAAREYVARHHDPATAARAVVDAATELGRRPARGASHASPGPVSSLTWSRIEGAIEVEGLERPWPEGERRRLSVRVTNRGAARWLAGGGPGCVALDLSLLDGEGRASREERRVLLPAALEPGDSEELAIEVRRPLGPARLRIEPRVLAGAGGRAVRVEPWESEI